MKAWPHLTWASKNYLCLSWMQSVNGLSWRKCFSPQTFVFLFMTVLMKLCLLFWNARTESEAKVGWIWNLCPAAFTVVSNPRSQRFRYCADEPRGRLPRLFGFDFFSYRYLWKFYVILILPVPPDHTLGHSLTVCLILLNLLCQWWVLSLPFWVFEIG